MTNIPRRRPVFGEEIILNDTDPRTPSTPPSTESTPKLAAALTAKAAAARLAAATVSAAKRSVRGIHVRVPSSPLIVACTAVFILTAGVSGLFANRESAGPEIKALLADYEDLRSEVSRLQSKLDALHEVAPRPDSRSAMAMSEASSEAAPEDTIPIRVASYTPTENERDDPFFGSKEAPVLMEVFSDFQCTLCRKYHREVILALREKYPEDELRVVFRDFPLTPNARAKDAAAFAHCAGEQSAYWEAFELLNESGSVYQTGDFRGLGQSLSTVNQTKLAQCLASKRYSGETDGDVADALKLGAKGAPSAFIGLRRSGNRYEGVFVRGAQPLAVIEQEIAGMLERSRP